MYITQNKTKKNVYIHINHRATQHIHSFPYIFFFFFNGILNTADMYHVYSKTGPCHMIALNFREWKKKLESHIGRGGKCRENIATFAVCFA